LLRKRQKTLGGYFFCRTLYMCTTSSTSLSSAFIAVSLMHHTLHF